MSGSDMGRFCKVFSLTTIAVYVAEIAAMILLHPLEGASDAMGAAVGFAMAVLALCLAAAVAIWRTRTRGGEGG